MRVSVVCLPGFGDGLLKKMDWDLVRVFTQRYRQNVVLVTIASVLVNLLVFAGSAYMLLVYDSVLPSRSVPTLFGLFVMLTLVYLLQGMLEVIRSEAMLGLANGLHRDLLVPVHRAAVSQTMAAQKESQGMQLMRDLDQAHTYLTSGGPIALIDVPWVPVFIIALAALHWALGLTALLGALVLIAIAWVTSRRTQDGTNKMLELTSRRISANQTQLRFAEASTAMGMRGRLLGRAKEWDESYLSSQSFLSRTVNRLGAGGRLFRLFLQSGMLTVGALLVLDGEASGGIILASSILAGRALAPIDQMLSNARGMAAAKAGWTRISRALQDFPAPSHKTVALDPPIKEVAVKDLFIVPPTAKDAVLTGVSFTLAAGDALAIVGPSAAGKTTLVKALLGIWPAARGEVRLDGATHDQWDRDVLGKSLGYLPQSIELLEGTIGENISRFEPGAGSAAIIAAAREAGMHETILALPGGYDAMLGPGGAQLSVGQRQRIALARALYGKPFLVVLDEPNSNLDAAGDTALGEAILGVRRRGGIVVMVTHRPATLGPISHVAVLTSGRLVDFGPRDEVLQRQAGDKTLAPASLQTVTVPAKPMRRAP